MAISRSTATVQALERLVSVLQERLPTFLEAISDDGLSLLAPNSGDYYLSGGYVAEQILNQPVSVLIDQFERSRADTRLSGDGSKHNIMVTLPVRIRLIFSVTAYDPLVRIGREQTRPEYLYHLSERYKGALMDALYTHARDGETISELEITSDYASVEQIRETLTGGCILELRITQVTDVPSPQYT